MKKFSVFSLYFLHYFVANGPNRFQMLTSDYVLENWCPSVICNYASENDIEIKENLAYRIVERFPEAPFGWVIAADARSGEESFSCVYWNEADAVEDAQICKEDGLVDIEITTTVDHEKMCTFLLQLSDDAQEERKASA